MNTLGLLLASRKIWVGTMTVIAIAAATTLVALGKLPASELTTTIAGLTAVGLGVIGSIAWEDVNKSKVQVAEATKPAPATTQTVNVSSVPPPAADG